MKIGELVDHQNLQMLSGLAETENQSPPKLDRVDKKIPFNIFAKNETRFLEQNLCVIFARMVRKFCSKTRFSPFFI
jgi:hypothetical protein